MLHRLQLCGWLLFVGTGPVLLWIAISLIEHETRGWVYMLAALGSFLCLYVFPSIVLAPVQAVVLHERLADRLSRTALGEFFGPIGKSGIPFWVLPSVLAFPSIYARHAWPEFVHASKVAFVVLVGLMVAFLISAGLSVRARRFWRDN